MTRLPQQGAAAATVGGAVGVAVPFWRRCSQAPALAVGASGAAERPIGWAAARSTSMLDLDDDGWRDLRHAYGSAADIPALLRQLPDAPVKSADSKREPWFSLWSALCHQSDVYPASFAAVPHIIAAAERRQPADRAEYLFLVGTIESMRHKASSPPLPTELEPAYLEALHAGVPLALEALQVEADRSWFQGLLAALAAFRGFPELGAAVSDLEREVECASCEATFVAPGYEHFT